MKLNNPLERVRDVIHSGMGEAGEGRTFAFINLDQLDPSPMQPRQDINGEAMEDLRQSIAAHGVLEPIIVRRKEDRYEIISGERRWRACRDIGVEEIPCVFKNVSDIEAFNISLTENVQRNNLTPLEEARAFRHMLDTKIARNQSEIGKILGIRQQRVSDKLKLLELPEEVQAFFGNGKYQDRFTQKHGEILGRLNDRVGIQEAAQKVIEKRLSTRETEKLVEQLLSKKPKEEHKKARLPRRLHVSRSRHGFCLKLTFDDRRDSIEDAIGELLKTIEKLRKDFAPPREGVAPPGGGAAPPKEAVAPKEGAT